MKITIARNAGFCFGVRRALDITFKVRRKNPGKHIFTVGPIIHNPQVIDAISRHGIEIINDTLDPKLESGNIVIIRAHGIPPDKKAALKARGVTVIDATCPMVIEVHAIMKRVAKDNDAIAILGDEHNPEIEAHLGVAGHKGILISSIEDAERMPPVDRLAVVAQTTFKVSLFKEIVEVLKDKANVLDVHDTICRATAERQKEVEELAHDHDTFIVIGGRNSGNTERLAEIAQHTQRQVYRVERADQLRNIDTSEIQRVAIIAGASTPSWVINDCIEALRAADKSSGLKNMFFNLIARSPLCPALGSLGIAMAAQVFSGKPYNWSVFFTVFFLAVASVNRLITRIHFFYWCIASGIAITLALLGSGLIGGFLIVGVAFLRPLMNTVDMPDYVVSLADMAIFMLISLIVPLALDGTSGGSPAIILLTFYAAVLYLGVDVLVGLKNLERDAIINRMSLVRYFGETKILLIMEYVLMGLSIVLFISFPLRIAPALVYGLLPALFFLGKGIDIYSDHLIFDKRLYLVYVKSLWLILPVMGLLWKFTMM